MQVRDTVLRWLEEFGRGARIVFALAVVVFVLAVTEFVASLSTGKAIDQERADVVEELSLIRARLEGEINSTLYLTRGMISYVATHPDLTWNDFEPLAMEMVTAGRHIRNLALAPDNVIEFIYPLAGNERALGLNYRENAQQWPAIQRAIDLGNTIVAGPLKLVQGGEGLIARTPIYVQDRTAYPVVPPKFWGIAAIVMDTPSLFSTAGVAARVGDLNVALRGKDGLGAEGDVFLGNAELFSTPGVVTQTVTLPNGAWQMAAAPAAGWGASDKTSLAVRGIGIVVALIFGGLVYSLLSLERRNRDLALHDHLTRLPNRRLMYDRLNQLAALGDRSKFGFTLLYIDLDGFKPINDEFGHHVGDKVLVEVGERLMALTRKSDTVARVGGDEFVIVLPGVTDASTLDGVLKKLHTCLNRPMKLGEREHIVQASVGVARFPEDADDVERLVNLADKNMYMEKNTNVANLRVV
ncbi:diguanylate cyclase domain-containing protein [Magnetovibrio sp.]|uniref:diguanylate cyclase domain-containing protein n=1 Tax=Magnetovibrio sp. TaxID=2024836 RepID=UPI002F934517